MRQIVIYGKGGIGKSTTASNLSASLACLGYRAMQIGCDPKHDSTRSLLGGKTIPTVLDQMRQRGNDNVELSDIVFEGYKGVLCIESGGPEPGVGCAGRGIIKTIQILKQLGAYEKYKAEIVIYDVLGDVVCGGFAMPLRRGLARETYIVTSGQLLSLYAASNICKAIQKYAIRNLSFLGGIICVSRKLQNEEQIVSEFARLSNSFLIKFVPFSRTVTKCEIQGKTVIEGAPRSKQAKIYHSLAKNILQNTQRTIPKPLALDQIEALFL